VQGLFITPCLALLGACLAARTKPSTITGETRVECPCHWNQ